MKYFLLFLFSFGILSLQTQAREGFRLHSDAAQYKGSDYANVIDVARGISLDKAFAIAESNPEIDYFVYMKGCQMVLEVPADVSYDPSTDRFGLAQRISFIYDSGAPGEGYCRIFRHGDVVFFKNEGIWLGSAPGLADTYIKE
ncbi:MAG TPA: hypothetical protein VGJ00_06735 [Rhabdochlamydiaceae bacterium]|jgi:hypothetical protein